MSADADRIAELAALPKPALEQEHRRMLKRYREIELQSLEVWHDVTLCIAEMDRRGMPDPY